MDEINISTNNSSYTLISQLGIVVNSELKNEFDHLLQDSLEEGRIIENLRKELSDSDIEEQVNSIRNITFNITENCCFRCSYCSFSGNYEAVRTHNPNRMSFSTAKKTIDYFFTWVTGEKRKLKLKSINFGFYGGEALLELDLMRSIIEYSQNRFKEKPVSEKFHTGYNLTTNGYLLKDNAVDFLVMNNFTIDVSLDGPQEEHDRFRITERGEKTWDVIWQNIKNLKRRYPDFYRDKVNFLVTLHPLHCFEKIDRFFLENPDYFDMKRVTVNSMNMLFLKEDIKQEILRNKANQSSKIELLKESERFMDKLKLKKLSNDTKFTAMCFPGGAKLFVATDGTLHICERIKPDFRIGDVENGIDFEAIRRIHRQWNEEIIKNRCWECIAWGFCTICLSQNEHKDSIKIDCKYKEYVHRLLYEYLSFKENEAIKTAQGKKNSIAGVKDYLGELQ